ncbi:MAG: serine kinase [Synergistaceae bacterium]|nr:serine kinase [Synergistaceae bacterium]
MDSPTPITEPTAAGICSALGLNVFYPGDGAREVKGAVVGDLLSHVLTEARENWLWVTVHTHLNVAAVAVVKGIPLVILVSGREPQEDLKKKCAEEGIALANTSLSCYELCRRLGRLGVGGPE